MNELPTVLQVVTGEVKGYELRNVKSLPNGCGAFLCLPELHPNHYEVVPVQNSEETKIMETWTKQDQKELVRLTALKAEHEKRLYREKAGKVLREIAARLEAGEDAFTFDFDEEHGNVRLIIADYSGVLSPIVRSYELFTRP